MATRDELRTVCVSQYKIEADTVPGPPYGRVDRSQIKDHVLVGSGSRVPSDAGQAFLFFLRQLRAPLAPLDPKLLSAFCFNIFASQCSQRTTV
eukprot:300795-Prymnesium_polylepis.1